eukprot:CAMPEP_0178685134 /NCGR_PEP_ID=MMETSP0699-20121125/3216_1 /TAXON_ID=265572 /ORGANISM="Extubocellulus spinifer, Strain CCMP396" /LENGTH=523 /DNA_ID=CAMNT_0020329857 /DNA_START=242 /DNA_END=1813 /DNA_ORIENTATION=+
MKLKIRFWLSSGPSSTGTPSEKAGVGHSENGLGALETQGSPPPSLDSISGDSSEPPSTSRSEEQEPQRLQNSADDNHIRDDDSRNSPEDERDGSESDSRLVVPSAGTPSADVIVVSPDGATPAVDAVVSPRQSVSNVLWRFVASLIVFLRFVFSLEIPRAIWRHVSAMNRLLLAARFGGDWDEEMESENARDQCNEHPRAIDSDEEMGGARAERQSFSNAVWRMNRLLVSAIFFQFGGDWDEDMESENARDQCNEHCLSPAPERPDDPIHTPSQGENELSYTPVFGGNTPLDGTASVPSIVVSSEGERDNGGQVDPSTQSSSSGKAFFHGRDENKDGNCRVDVSFLKTITKNWFLRLKSTFASSHTSAGTEAGTEGDTADSTLADRAESPRSTASTNSKPQGGLSLAFYYFADRLARHMGKKEVKIVVDTAHMRDGVKGMGEALGSSLERAVNIDTRPFAEVLRGACDEAGDKAVGVCDKTVDKITNVCYHAIYCTLIVSSLWAIVAYKYLFQVQADCDRSTC